MKCVLDLIGGMQHTHSLFFCFCLLTKWVTIFADDIWMRLRILIYISLKFDHDGPIDNKSALSNNPRRRYLNQRWLISTTQYDFLTFLGYVTVIVLW